MTKSEACMWKYILRARMLKGYLFRRQRPVAEYIVDFMCKELNLIIEVDGLTHQHDEVALKDEVRDKRLQHLGYTVLRFTSKEVLMEINGVRSSIEQWVEDNAPLSK